jgi:hypothetical protein
MNENINNEIKLLKQTVQNQSNEIQVLTQNIKYRDIAISFYKSLIQSRMNIKLPEHNIFEDDVVVYSNVTKYNKKNVKMVNKQKNVKMVNKQKNVKMVNKQKVTKVKKEIKLDVQKIKTSQNKPTTKNKKLIIKKNIPSEIKFNKEKSKEEILKMISDINLNNKIDNNSPTDKLWVLNFKEHENNISKLLFTLESARSYGKVLSEIKYHRLHFLKFLDEETYKKRIVKYIDMIKEIFKNRGSDDKKIKSLMKHKIINAYEHRMLMLNDFEKTNIDIDEVNLIRKCFEHKIKCKTNFEVFSSESLTQNICNYQLCISNILTILSNTVTNIYGFHNIVYLQFDNNNFAFYYLENISKNKRKWIMDCRLDDIINEVHDKALSYCISMFRKIYQKIFYDNQYRYDFIEVSQVMELEGIQLLKNIIYLNDYLQLVKDFQNIIKNCNKYSPTEIDEFNLFTNDPLLKIEDKTIKIEDQFKNIFDNITKKESNELYSLIQKQK